VIGYVILALVLLLVIGGMLLPDEPTGCPYCGARDSLYATEPYPSIWAMQCSACGRETDRHGNRLD
jgi:hypothetical protein